MLTLALCLLLAQPADTAPASPAPPAPAVPPAPVAPPAVALPAPHPMITEVLYAVPPGPAGDANKDGRREVNGDEFIELVNPHDKPIQLFGYTLTDSQDPDKGQLKFTFPAFELPPGGVVVVFNGLGGTFAPPVGDSRTPPPGPSDAFGGAWVFTMKNTNSRHALSNSGDHVLLCAPDGTPVQRVWWNEELPNGSAPAAPTPHPQSPPASAAPPKPRAPLLDDYAPALQRTSVQRDSVLRAGRFVSHAEAGNGPFSPGVYTIAPAPPRPAPATPAAPPAPAPDSSP